MERVGIGIIGVGGFGRTHLRAVEYAQSNGLAELRAAVILPGLEQETEARMRGEGVVIYRSHEEMLREAGGEIELVGVPCGIDQHEPLSVAALEAGYHVLCEKPAAGDRAQALSMQRASHRAGKSLAIGYQNIYSPTIQRIKEIALSGSLGRLVRAKTMVLWPRPASYYRRNGWAGRLRVNGRAIYDSPVQNATAHYLENMLYVAGSSRQAAARPVKLYGENYRVKEIESADTQFLRIDTLEGPLLTFMTSHATVETRSPRTEYTFEKGRILWSADGGGRMEVFRGSPESAEPEESLDNGEVDIHHLPYLDTVQAIRQGREPLCTIDNAMAHTMCVDALFTRCDLVQVDESFAKTRRPFSDTDDSSITWLPGIDELMERMYGEEKSYYETGAPWAKPGKEVSV